jgi:4'-phosphopantetheinyl transferase
VHEAIDVWLIGTDLPDPVLADLELLLDDRERQRARSLLRDDHRRRFVAAHGAVRVIIGRRLGVPPARVCWRHGPHGKPELAGAWTGAHVSMSRSGRLAALALASGRRVGVDIEQVQPGLDATGMSARCYPVAEAEFVAAGRGPACRADRFIRLWTRKEACVKVAGGQLQAGLALPARGRATIVVSDSRGPLPGPYLVKDISAPPGFRAAVAAEGALPYRVARFEWPGEVACGYLDR